MMNYKTMPTAQLLEEKSYMEQIGTPGSTQLLDIMEELNNRRNQATPIEVSYTKNAAAVIYPEYIEFYANERGTKRMTLTRDELTQGNLLSFYRSEYLANGIRKKVLNKEWS
jgi:hypothetical protein